MIYNRSILNFLLFLIILPSLLVAAPPPWIDLPPDDYTQILNCHKEIAYKLNQQIAVYTRLPKSSLQERISALVQVIVTLADWIQQEQHPYLYEQLSQLLEIADNKKWYLEQLRDAYDNKKFEDHYLLNTLRNTEKLKKNRKALFMINERRYHTKYGEYWGEYWLEAMDPCHRQLMTYRDRWKKEKEKDASTPHFFLWLEDQNLSKDVPYLIYLSDQELKNATAQIKDGLLYFSNQLIGHEVEAQFLFIVDLNENLIIAPGSKLIHHNSLSHSKPILAGGKMNIDKGEVTLLSFETGHYIPTIEDDIRMIHLLKELGIKLSNSTPCVYYDENGCHELAIGRFLEIYDKLETHSIN